MGHGDKKNTPKKPINPPSPDQETTMMLAMKGEIEALKKQVEALSTRVDEAESYAALTATVNSRLQKELDRLEQYGRRHSVVIRGIAPAENETNDQLIEKVKQVVCVDNNMKADINRDFDKTHRIGPVTNTDSGPKQDVIVRFKSHSTRYKVYHKRKDIKEKKKVRITPSLTTTRRKLLSTARNQHESNELVDFIFTDMHGDIKVKFKQNVKGKLFHVLSCIEDLEELLGIDSEEI